MPVEILISGTRGETVKVGEITSARATTPDGLPCHYHEHEATANCHDVIPGTRGKPKITISGDGRGRFIQKEKFTR